METVFVIAALKLVGYGLATIGPGLGIGIACYGCCVGTALIGFVLAFIL